MFLWYNIAMQDIKNLNLKELQELLAAWGENKFHARQIFSWIYQKGAQDFIRMSDLSEGLRKKLENNFSFSALTLSASRKSHDGTEKSLFSLDDGNRIEAVVIPMPGHVTACLSTQVGCKFACRFCASGLSGFKRNLTCGEIISQVLALQNKSGAKRITHLVFMGSGEPLDNYDQVIKTIRVINSKEGLNIGARRMTVSTCGIVPGIKRLAQEKLQIELSVSLHAPDDRLRSQLVPANKKYPLKDLLAACKEYIRATGRQITFEYVLIRGINSDLPKAQKLSTILKDLKLCKVNLIPVNPVKEYGITPPGKLEILLFKDCLFKSGIPVTLRKSRGEDVQAACGQLRSSYEKK